MIRTTTVMAGLVGAALLAAAGPALAGPALAGLAGSSGPSAGRVRTVPTSGPGMPAATPPPAVSPPAASPAASSPTSGTASPVPARPRSRTALTLSYTADAGYAAAIKLGCDPATGPHPEKKQACAVLKKVGGDPDRLTPARTMCMLIYAPVRADITGTWKGRPVRWSKTYGNTCELTRATNVLFAF